MPNGALNTPILSPAWLRRYGFVVYQDASVTDIACAGLNGMRMGERTLTVRRATEVRQHAPAMRCMLPRPCEQQGGMRMDQAC